MSILSDLTTMLDGLGVSVETGVFSDVAPNEYVVITPLTDSFELFRDNHPEYETQEARLSLYTIGNYLKFKSTIVKALLLNDYTITERRYIGHEDDTKYHHYAIDTARIYSIGE